MFLVYDLYMLCFYLGDSADRKQLIKKKAEWALKINEPRAAAEMFLSAGDTIHAIKGLSINKVVSLKNKVNRTKEDQLFIPLTFINGFLIKFQVAKP